VALLAFMAAAGAAGLQRHRLMLFTIGWYYGRGIGRSPWLFGMSMVLLGAALVAMAIPLGG
jgi:hypothetical protein